jgi:hypothetical protein
MASSLVTDDASCQVAADTWTLRWVSVGTRAFLSGATCKASHNSMKQARIGTLICIWTVGRAISEFWIFSSLSSTQRQNWRFVALDCSTYQLEVCVARKGSNHARAMACTYLPSTLRACLEGVLFGAPSPAKHGFNHSITKHAVRTARDSHQDRAGYRSVAHRTTCHPLASRQACPSS